MDTTPLTKTQLAALPNTAFGVWWFQRGLRLGFGKQPYVAPRQTEEARAREEARAEEKAVGEEEDEEELAQMLEDLGELDGQTM